MAVSEGFMKLRWMLTGGLTAACWALACGSSNGSNPGGDDGGGSNGGATDGGAQTETGSPSTPPPSCTGASTLPTVAGCGSTTLLTIPDDPSARGPWPVGAKTVTVAGLTTEIWYPAKPGCEAGKDKVTYDIREYLPDADRTKIPDAENPPQNCDCYRDLPIDDAHGPYPVVVFIHGTASFRTQSAHTNTQWASRGFVVISSDHPGIQLKDVLASGGFPGASDQVGNARKTFAALQDLSGDLAFLAGHIDTSHMAASGHSAGGSAVSGLGDVAQVLIPMAAAGTKTPASNSILQSSLVMGGEKDGIGSYTNQQKGYASSPVKKRLIGVKGAGHLAFSDLCVIGRDQGGILQVAIDHGVTIPALVSSLAKDGCIPAANYLPAEDGWKLIDYVSTAVLEEALTCNPTSTAKLAATPSLDNVLEYQEQLQ
jgi:hypothetical protein